MSSALVQPQQQQQQQPATAAAVEGPFVGKFFPVETDDSAQDSASRLAVQKMLANLSGYMYKPMYECNHLRTEDACEKPELMDYDKKRLERQHEEEVKRFRERLATAKSNVDCQHDSESDDDVESPHLHSLEPQEDTTSVTTVLHCPPENPTLPEKPKLPEDYGNRSKAAKKRARQKANRKKGMIAGEKAPGAGVARDVPIIVGWPGKSDPRVMGSKLLLMRLCSWRQGSRPAEVSRRPRRNVLQFSRRQAH